MTRPGDTRPGQKVWDFFLLGRREVAHVLAQGHICDMITFLLLPATFFVGTQERKQPEETNLLQTGSKLWFRFLLTLFVFCQTAVSVCCAVSAVDVFLAPICSCDAGGIQVGSVGDPRGIQCQNGGSTFLDMHFRVGGASKRRGSKLVNLPLL